MHITRENCPNQMVRQAFVNGDLSDAMAESVAEHVANCRECSEEVDSQFAGRESSIIFSEAGQEQIEQFVEKVMGDFSSQSDSRGLSIPPFAPASHLKTDPANFIGRYRILESIGRGSFGEVHLGVHPVLRSQVAIKVSHVAFHSQHQKQLFLREAETAAHLDHPNVVRVVDADDLPDSRCFIVFDYVQGSNLKELLAGQRLHTSQALHLFNGILAGVQHAHQRGVVHRDLKPSNVLIDQDMRPRVTDFGLALMRSGTQQWIGLGGTRGYMAPEQENCEINRIDARTDIFALGIILAELLCGKTLRLKGPSAEFASLFESLLETAGVPKDLLRICCKCCMSRQKDRYQTIDELREDLKLLPIRATRDSFAPIRMTSVGLQTFRREDESAYLEWLTIGRFGDDLANSLKYWRSRIERFGYEPCFGIGIISGQRSSGKSSFLQAGLIPSLKNEVKVKFFDCKVDSCLSIEDFLFHFDTSGARSPINEKTLVIIDHFLVSHFSDFEVLSRALRRVDGSKLQCLLICDSGQLPETLALFDELELALDPLDNYYRMPVLDKASAKRLLLQLGTIHKCLPESEVIALAVVDQIVERIHAEEQLNLTFLQMFAENCKDRQWDLKFAASLDSMIYIRFSFANKHLFTEPRPKQLLPVLNLMLENSNKIKMDEIANELCDRKVVTEVLPYLTAIRPRLIVKSPNETEAKFCYEFAHFYLRETVEAFVSETERLSSNHGRAWYQLHRDANRWNATHSDDDLMPFGKLLPSLWLATTCRLTLTEQKYFWRSILKISKTLAYLCVVLFSLLFVLTAYRNIENMRVAASLTATDDAAVQGVEDSWYYSPAISLLLKRVNDKNLAEEDRSRALRTLSKVSVFPTDAFVDFVQNTSADRQLIIFESASDAIVSKKLEIIEALKAKTRVSKDSRQLRYELHLLNLGKTRLLEQRAAQAKSISEHLDLVRQVREVISESALLRLAIRDSISNQLRAVLLDAMNFEDIVRLKDDLPSRQLVDELATIAKGSDNPRLKSCCLRVIRGLGGSARDIFPEWNEVDGQAAYVNSAGVLMLPAPDSSEALSDAEPLMFAATEVGYEHMHDFWELGSSMPINYHVFLEQLLVDGAPATSITPRIAMEFCNYLSVQEGRTPYYVLPRDDFADHLRFHLGNWERHSEKYSINPKADGYRLPHIEEWKPLVKWSEAWTPRNLEMEKSLMFGNFFKTTTNDARFIWISRPDQNGYFDLLGNCTEIGHEQGTGRWAYLGGMFYQTIADSDQPRVFDYSLGNANCNGLRICCPSKIKKS